MAMLSFQKWFLRKPPASPQTDSAFPHILTSSVDPALLIPVRSKRNGWVWPVGAVAVIVVGSIVIVRPGAITIGIHRLETANSWIGNALQGHSEVPLPLGLLVVAIGSVVLLWLLPKWQASGLRTLTPEARFDKENESRKTLAQIVGGLFVIGSLFATARTLQVSQQQAAASASQAATAADQLQVARQGQITERFTKAIDQLGREDKLELQLGGIYALERIANESREDHWPIVEILTTYVRVNAPLQNASKNLTKDPPTSIHPKPDIQAILTVLARRNSQFETGKRINLTSTDLREAHLTGANLEIADLTGADLTGADLKRADLTRALLTGAYLERADLTGAYLKGADLTGALLTGANLERADLTGANLESAYLESAYLERANLMRALLMGAHLTGALLVKAFLAGASLMGADLSGADLRGAIGLTVTQIGEAVGDSNTELPARDGITRPNSWRKR